MGPAPSPRTLEGHCQAQKNSHSDAPRQARRLKRSGAPAPDGGGSRRWELRYESDLSRGKIGLFSTDTLIDMLARLGVTVRIAFDASKSRGVA